ncbi:MULTISPECIES: glycosyltransferase [Modicisalibacter]|uniref:Glycosyltransferase n=1 Tax=Modicisalibacter tunisiensis TaxID=390637 RepID=A0ABS7WWE8_9GAMM|nr:MULTISPECIES: glycosyltransferase [Modicisalibacter]MBZ9566670.1 glycosyltransferase [Modicisalibacter tunisiensis]
MKPNSRILFLHVNFPGQFRHLAPALHQAGHDVRAVTLNAPPESAFPVTRATLPRGNPPDIDPLLRQLDSKIIRGRATQAVLQAWRDEGWVPDLVIGHAGWGDMMTVRELFPDSRCLGWFEFYYQATGLDADFDAEFPVSEEARLRIRLKNLWPLWMLEHVDAGICSTHFQKATHPQAYHDRLHVIHEGIDTQRFRPNDKVRVSLGDRLTLTRDTPVVTFVNRDLEPYRGYHVFMRALPEILTRNPDAHVLIVGGDGVSYGSAPGDGRRWKTVFLEEVAAGLDERRVHFLGRVPHDTLTALMQLSRAHVYLTYPFVLSWSLLEAMSCAAPIIGSDTAPVREVITSGENGYLVDFFDRQALVDAVSEALAHPEAMAPLRDRARRTILDHYDLHTQCLPQQLALIDSLL